MTEKDNMILNPEVTAARTPAEETALMIEGLYNGIVASLKKLKTEICNEMKYSSVQMNAYCEMAQKEATHMVAKNQATIQAVSKELKYGYQQNQMIHEDLGHLISDEVMGKLNTLEGKLAALEEIDKILPAIEETVASLTEKIEALKVGEDVLQSVKETLTACESDTYESVNYDKVTEIVDAALVKSEGVVLEQAQEMVDKASAAVAEQSQQILNAIAAIEMPQMPEIPEVDYDKIIDRTTEKVVESLPYADRIDYKQIEEIVQANAIDVALLGEEISEKILEKLPQPEVAETVNYDEIADLVSEKVPAPEMIDYERLADTVIAKMPTPVEPEAIDYDKLAETVMAKMPVPETIDYDKLADAVVAKMPAPEAIDYDKLADVVVAKLPVPEAIDYDKLADTVVAKMPIEEKEAPCYDVVMDEEGVEKVANGVYGKLNLDIIAEKVAEKVTVSQPELDYEALADMVADRLAVKVEILTEPVEEVTEETVEETAEEPEAEQVTVEEVIEEVAEETVEEPVEEVEEVVAEEIVEETVEEPVEETVEEVEEVVEEVEETVEEVVEEVAAEDATEELAVAEHAHVYEESGNDLVDAETGLVVRLKRSFTAKLKQSDEEIKVYYDMIKNELGSYKKLKSTVSWHGDRFNLGRATVAKMNICGKTLCFYIALDPNDPELKSTVYHQKDVGDQKAYQATPFKVKVKSEMGAKRVVRLIMILAEKMGAVKKADFVPTDYVQEFAYETTKELLEKGLIKETKEKKIAFEF